jgi:hypothetical protein
MTRWETGNPGILRGLLRYFEWPRRLHWQMKLMNGRGSKRGPNCTHARLGARGRASPRSAEVPIALPWRLLARRVMNLTDLTRVRTRLRWPGGVEGPGMHRARCAPARPRALGPHMPMASHANSDLRPVRAKTEDHAESGPSRHSAKSSGREVPGSPSPISRGRNRQLPALDKGQSHWQDIIRLAKQQAQKFNPHIS